VRIVRKIVAAASVSSTDAVEPPKALAHPATRRAQRLMKTARVSWW
jgi:hypothetical protein